MVVELPSDFIGEPSPDDRQKLEAWRREKAVRDEVRIKRIRDEPGLARYLVALADKQISDGEWEGLAQIMSAIAVRSDIGAADIQRYIDKTKELLDFPSDRPQPLRDNFLLGMTDVMKTHPSAENEDLLIKIVYLYDDYRGVNLKVAAGGVLAINGTSKALPALEYAASWCERFVTTSGEPTIWKSAADSLVGNVASLRKKLGVGESLQGKKYPAETIQQNEGVAEDVFNRDKEVNIGWYACLVFGVALCLVYLLKFHRKR